MTDTLKRIKENSTDETFAENLLKDVFDSLISAEKSMKYSKYDGQRVPAWELVAYLKRRYNV